MSETSVVDAPSISFVVADGDVMPPSELDSPSDEPENGDKERSGPHEVQEGGERREVVWTREMLLSLPGEIHNMGIEAMEELYVEDADREVNFYHNNEYEDGTNGHVADLVGMMKAYFERSSKLSDTSEDEQPLSPREIDPLKIYEKTWAFLKKKGSSEYIEAWEAATKGEDSETDDKEMGIKNRRELIEFTLVTAARFHDLGNVIGEGSSNEIDWQAIREGKPLKEAVPLRKEMRFKGAEEAAANMFNSYMVEFAPELDLDDPELLLAVQRLGMEVINQTEFKWGFYDEKDQEQDRSTAIIEMAVMDQVGGMFNPNGLKQVFGLVNEAAVRDRDKSVSERGRFVLTDYFGGFIDKRFEEYRKQGGVSRSEFVEYFDKWKNKSPEEFAKAMGVDMSDKKEFDRIVEQIRSIENLDEFISTRFEIQKRVASLLWAEDKADKMVDGQLDFVEAWNLTDEQREFADEACKLYKTSFWDKDLSVDDFDKLKKGDDVAEVDGDGKI